MKMLSILFKVEQFSASLLRETRSEPDKIYAFAMQSSVWDNSWDCSNVCHSAWNIRLGYWIFHSIRIDWESDANKRTDFTAIIWMRQIMGGGKSFTEFMRTDSIRIDSILFHVVAEKKAHKFWIAAKLYIRSVWFFFFWPMGAGCNEHYQQSTNGSSSKSRSMCYYQFLYV